MLIHATTAAWGTWHVDQLLSVSLPSLLAPGNMPALAKAHRGQFNLVTTREDQLRIEATPVFAQLRELMDVKVRMLPDNRIGVPIAMQHRIWAAAQQRARRARALALFLPPDVIWSDGSLASLSRRIDEGKRALFNTYLRVASDSIASDLDREFRIDGTRLAVPPRALVAAGFRHLHPLMSCYLADSNHFPHHPEMIAFGVRGEGLIVRLLTRELFCFEPARFALTEQALLREVPDPNELHVFDDSDELCALSLTPLFKDHDWYTARNVIDPAEVGLWWLQYDSPSNRFLWQRPIRYHAGDVTEEKWATIERESEPLFHEFERVRELLRLHRALRTVGLDAFARVLGEATLRGDLARYWDPREPATLLVPTDRAVEALAHELSSASAERLTRFLVAHCKTGHLDLPAPWRARARTALARAPRAPASGGGAARGLRLRAGRTRGLPDRPDPGERLKLRGMPSGQGLRRFAVASALVLGNTLGLLVAVNLLIAPYLEITGPPTRPAEPSARERGDAALARQGMDVFRRVYPGKSDAEIRALVRGQAVLDTSYEPFAEFRSPALTEEGVTIHEAGFRMIGPDQGPWPLDSRALNVFVFGGSTAFGGGVDDEEAIPSQLQALLRAAFGHASLNVYNFGVGASFSSQEVTYFQNQLRYGNIPDLVVFFDGLNDFAFPDGLTAASEYYRDSMRTIRSLQRQLGRDRGFLWHAGELVRSLPMARLAERIAHPPAPPTPVGDATADPLSDPLLADRGRLAAIIDRYLVNRDVAAGVAERFGIEAVFVWQPIPLYKYDTSFHPFEIPVGHRLSGFGYPLMAELVAEGSFGRDFVWCADIQESLREPLYVDAVHYTAAMSRRVAECIARGVLDSGALERAWSRFQAGRPVRVAARALLGPRRERAVARLFGPSAQTPDLAVEGPLDGHAGESRLVDASPRFASVFQDIVLAPDARGVAYRVAFRLRAGSSPAAQLVLQFSGARSETYEVSFDPRAMQLRSGRGLASLEPQADGWYHLSLLAASPGAESLRVQLIPRQGEAEDTGDLVFGGGTLWAVETPADVAAPGLRER